MVVLVIVLIALAVATEYLVERIKNLVQVTEVGKVKLVPFYALAVGMAIAFIVQLDFIAVLSAVTEYEMHTVPTAGYIMTGLAISGGSGAIHELFSKLRESRAG